MSEQLVLVTGGTGFVGLYCILHALRANYRVRTTVRSLSRKDEVLKQLQSANAPNLDTHLSFVEADLLRDAGWPAAVEECTYVLHVASPFPAGVPKHEDDLIVPAREGTLRVLRAAKAAGVKRVVVTSSMAAIGYGHHEIKEPLSEKMWTDINGPGVGAYHKSKTLAERAAWDYIQKEGGSLELSVVNPVGIFGPVMGSDFATSILVVQRMLNGDLPGLPNLEFAVVDVRDVADLHLKAMVDPKAKGERFLAVAPPPMTMLEISKCLRDNLGEKAKRSPTRVLPNFVLRIVGLWDVQVGLIVQELGKRKPITNEKARTVLGWEPRSREDAILATAESLIRLRLVKN